MSDDKPGATVSTATAAAQVFTAQCGKCGVLEVEPEAKACPQCNNPLISPAAAAAPDPTTPEPGAASSASPALPSSADLDAQAAEESAAASTGGAAPTATPLDVVTMPSSELDPDRALNYLTNALVYVGFEVEEAGHMAKDAITELAKRKTAAAPADAASAS